MHEVRPVAHPTVVGVAVPSIAAVAPAAGRETIRHMNPQLSARVLVALSSCYGVLLGVLAILHVHAIGIVAIIGAIILGLMWTVRGIFVRRTTTTSTR
jgi:hypothetical protein